MTDRRPEELLERLLGAEAAAALPHHLVRQRWFGGRGRELAGVRVVEVVAVHDDPALTLVSLLVEVHLTDREGDGDLYQLLLSRRPASEAVTADADDARLLCTATVGDVPMVAVDAMYDGPALVTLWEALRGSRIIAGAAGDLRFRNLRMGPATPSTGQAGATEPPHIRPLGREQSNSSAVRDEVELLKVLRRVSPGVSPELEMTGALAAAGFSHTPAPLGYVEYVPPSGEPILLATVQPFLHNGTEGWSLALTSLRALYADVEEAMGPAPGGIRAELVFDEDGLSASTFAAEATRLGRVTAEMHLALLEAGPEPALAAHPATPEELGAWSREMVAELDTLLARGEEGLRPLRARRPELVAVFDAVGLLAEGGMAIRVHGDYHLGQTLRTDDGWTVLDFEGEPDLPLATRRHHASALRDVAGMLRSFDYAAAAALAERIEPTDDGWASLQPRGDVWARANREAFWTTYASTVAGSGLLPPGDGAGVMLRAHELRKAVYETGYELGHRPTWVSIPLRFLLAGGPP